MAQCKQNIQKCRQTAGRRLVGIARDTLNPLSPLLSLSRSSAHFLTLHLTQSMGNTHPQPSTPPDAHDISVFQVFRPANNRLVRMQSKSCAETGKRHILWSEIQHAFEDIDYLTDEELRCLFMTGKDGEVYVFIYSSSAYQLKSREHRETVLT